jgi:hypothetical protein
MRGTLTRDRDARRRLKRYRQYYGDEALLIVPFRSLPQHEQWTAISVATLLGARLALECGDDASADGVATCGNAIVTLVIEPLARLAVEWDLRAPEAIDPADLAAWHERVRANGACDDPRARAFCHGWAGIRMT